MKKIVKMALVICLLVVTTSLLADVFTLARESKQRLVMERKENTIVYIKIVNHTGNKVKAVLANLDDVGSHEVFSSPKVTLNVNEEHTFDWTAAYVPFSVKVTYESPSKKQPFTKSYILTDGDINKQTIVGSNKGKSIVIEATPIELKRIQ